MIIIIGAYQDMSYTPNSSKGDFIRGYMGDYYRAY